MSRASRRTVTLPRPLALPRFPVALPPALASVVPLGFLPSPILLVQVQCLLQVAGRPALNLVLYLTLCHPVLLPDLHQVMYLDIQRDVGRQAIMSPMISVIV